MIRFSKQLKTGFPGQDWRLRQAWPAIIAILAAAALLLSACQTAPKANGQNPGLKVLAVETFLADIAQNVAGDRLTIQALVPIGADPHEFEPTPQDIARISQSSLLIINGTGFELWLQKTLEAAGGTHTTVEASTGLVSRTPREGEAVMHAAEPANDAGDPHFWLDPLSVVKYVENIRDGLIQVDPQGKEIYTQNADIYIAKLKELNAWIADQVKQIPLDHRRIVTNHESFGYFADRYGFQIIGTVIPSVSSSASPSAQQLARLVDSIRAAHAPAIFLETGTNPQLANQVAQETGIKVITGLQTHSITAPGGDAPTYIDMMRMNTKLIVAALK
ncbi:MAG: zinc ABC transporter substrate-binding protein, partial [Anaerolineaceae bacterium]|nr:zinc ABC transporter substrate-binding protein [Anaerolineaceae bacterium]